MRKRIITAIISNKYIIYNNILLYSNLCIAIILSVSLIYYEGIYDVISILGDNIIINNDLYNYLCISNLNLCMFCIPYLIINLGLIIFPSRLKNINSNDYKRNTRLISYKKICILKKISDVCLFIISFPLLYLTFNVGSLYTDRSNIIPTEQLYIHIDECFEIINDLLFLVIIFIFYALFVSFRFYLKLIKTKTYYKIIT